MNPLEVAVLVVAAGLAARVLVRRPLRVEALAHPWLALLAAVGGLAALAGVVWGSRRWEFVRHAVIGLAATASIVAVWRASPRYGRRRGLPPGSLGLATSLDAIGDPAFYRRAAERWGGVFKMSQVHRPVVCIADLGLAHDLFRAHADDLAQSEWSFNRLVPGGYLEYMRSEAHATYRGLLGAGFAGTDFSACRDVIRAASRSQLAALGEASRGRGADPEPFLLPVAMAALLRAVLGVPPHHPRHASLVSLFTDLLRPMELHLPVPQRARVAYAALVAEVRALGNTVGTAPGEVMPSVLSALVTRSPTTLHDDTLVGNLVLMVKEGSIMVRGLLRWVLKMRCDHPVWAARLRALAHDEPACESLCRRFVLETLRLHESRYVYRVATEDLSVGPYRVPAGWLVRLCVGEAHERDDRFPDPHTFNPERFAGDPLARDDFVPFGQGAHACLGADLTLEVAQAFLREAALRFDVSTVADGAPWRVNRHWGIWRPSRAWRVVASPMASQASRPADLYLPNRSA